MTTSAGLAMLEIQPSAPVPTLMRMMSDAAHTATIQPTWVPRKPLRNTKAFWAPMAMIKDKPAPNPAAAAAITAQH